MNNLNQHTAAGLAINEYEISGQPNFIPDTPSIFTFELTQICNNNCSGCANVDLIRKKTGANPDVHMDNWLDLINKVTPHADVLRLSGGEPTLHPDIVNIIKYVDSLDIKHALFTTGRWQHRKKASIISTYAECQNSAGMLISLHGTKPEYHNAFVESSSNAFFETCENIKLATSNGINVFISAVLTKFCCEEIEEIVEKGMNLGASQIVFNRFISVNHPLLPSDVQLKTVLEKIRILKLQGYPCRIGNNIPPCFLPNANEVAKAGYELCHISTKGAVRPDNLTNLTFGNLNTQDIKEIWKTPIAQIYRFGVNAECQRCSAFPRCRGGSKSIQFEYNLSSDPLMKFPLDQFIIPGNEDPKDSVFRALTSD